MRLILLEEEPSNQKNNKSFILSTPKGIQQYLNTPRDKRYDLLKSELTKLNKGTEPEDIENLILNITSNSIDPNKSPFLHFIINHYTNGKADFPKDSELVSTIFALQQNKYLSSADINWLEDYNTLLNENDENNAYKVHLIAFVSNKKMQDKHPEIAGKRDELKDSNGRWLSKKAMQYKFDEWTKDEILDFEIDEGTNAAQLEKMYKQAYPQKELDTNKLINFII